MGQINVELIANVMVHVIAVVQVGAVGYQDHLVLLLVVQDYIYQMDNAWLADLMLQVVLVFL